MHDNTSTVRMIGAVEGSCKKVCFGMVKVERKMQTHLVGMLFVEAFGVVVPGATLPFTRLWQLLLQQVQLQRRTRARAGE